MGLRNKSQHGTSPSYITAHSRYHIGTGSGGCNLLIIDENGKTLSNTTVVKLPIYLPATTIEGMKSKGSWKPLYVWSQGFRKLDSEDGKYPSNASMAMEVPQEELEGHPENYQLVLDYLE